MISVLFALWEWRGRRKHSSLRVPEKTSGARRCLSQSCKWVADFGKVERRAFKQRHSRSTFADWGVVEKPHIGGGQIRYRKPS